MIHMDDQTTGVRDTVLKNKLERFREGKAYGRPPQDPGYTYDGLFGVLKRFKDDKVLAKNQVVRADECDKCILKFCASKDPKSTRKRCNTEV